VSSSRPESYALTECEQKLPKRTRLADTAVESTTIAASDEGLRTALQELATELRFGREEATQAIPASVAVRSDEGVVMRLIRALVGS
jgi:hypothetical protein